MTAAGEPAPSTSPAQSAPSSIGEWAAAANWAARHRRGLDAVARRMGVGRIEAALGILEWWREHPEQFEVPEPEVPPGAGDYTTQCPECGIWFVDVGTHHKSHAVPRTRSTVPPTGAGSGRAAIAGRVPGGPKSPSDWAALAVWAARSRTGVDGIARRTGLAPVDVRGALGVLWRDRRELAAMRTHVSAPQGRTAHDGARLQCSLCALWVPDLRSHLPLHGMRFDQYRSMFRLGDDAPRTIAEALALERTRGT